MSNYVLGISRADADDGAWTVTVRGHPEWTFRERNFSSIDNRVYEIAKAQFGPDAKVGGIIYENVSIGGIDITGRLSRLRELRREIEKISAEIDTTTDDLILLLRRQVGLTTRDTATVVGLSHARIHQREREIQT